MFFGKIAHKQLLYLQSARIPPCQANQECIRPSTACQAGRFGVEEQPSFWIFQCSTRLAGERFVTRARKQFKCCGRGVDKLGRGKPVSDGEVLAEMIGGDASAE